MDLSNTKIIVASKEIAKNLEGTRYLSLIETFDQYKIFQTNNTGNAYVVALKNKVYTIADLSVWKKVSEKWYNDYSGKSPFIVYDPSIGQSPFIPYDANKIPLVPYREDCKVQEFVQRGIIKIHTNCLGRPLLVKFSYHQNWQVKGAQKVYLATPAFMIVIPKEADVTLYYGKRPYNYLAYACGIIGILLLFSYTYIENGLISFYKKLSKKYKKISYLLSLVAQKIRLSTIGNYISKISVPCMMILLLLVSIAFVYTNKG